MKREIKREIDREFKSVVNSKEKKEFSTLECLFVEFVIFFKRVEKREKRLVIKVDKRKEKESRDFSDTCVSTYIESN